jgi:hypothetical protein
LRFDLFASPKESTPVTQLNVEFIGVVSPMEDTNVIDLRHWFGREPPDGRPSHDECLQLMKAFVQIQNPSLRALVIKSVQGAASQKRGASNQ